MKDSQGFTLIEIMVVVVILGILAAVISPIVVDKIGRARVQAAKADIRSIESALALYKMDNYGYPATELGLRALVEQPPRADAPNWQTGYLRKLPTDPWGHLYLYTNNGAEIEIYTLGADHRVGGTGEAADIHWSDL